MKNRTKSLLTLLFAFALSTSFAEGDTLLINLGLYPPGSVTSIQKNQDFKLLIIENRIPMVAYGVEISAEMQMLPPLNADGSGGQNTPNIAAECEKLQEAYMAVSNYATGPSPPTDEKEEAKLMPLVNALKTARGEAKCSDAELITAVDNLLLSTTQTLREEIPVRTGEKVTIKITRGDKVWTFIFKGKEKGVWVPTYGFGFTSVALESPTYYAKAVPDTSTFEILKASKPDKLELNYVPAIFYSFFPSQNFDKALNHSLTAGLGFDMSAPVVFLGYNLLYHHNIGISLGVAFQQQYQLKDQYSEGEIISISLDNDQLNNLVYRPNFFLAVNFRFGSNPFEGSQESSSE